MVKIVTDSDANLPPEFIAEHDVHVVPIQIHIDGKDYKEGVDLSNQEFIELIETAQSHPTTSQPSSGQFYSTYLPLVSDGHSVVSIHVSGELSGTVQSAQSSLELFPSADIHVVDSRSVSLGQGLVVLHAVRLAQAGYGAREIAQALQPIIQDMQIFFVLETLDYLRRGGRIGGVAHLVGSMLSFRPILTVRDGNLEAVGRQRSRSKALAQLRQLALERARAGVYLGVIHIGALDEATTLAEELRAKIEPVEFLFSDIGPGLSIHSGPGAVGFALYAPLFFL
jgi:DegV family protein with EDD domain